MSTENIKRKCTIFIADNNDEPIALLYDSGNNFSGAAKNIVYTCERNGAKSLSFILPTPEKENGEEQNYLWDYVVPEYHIVFVLDDVEDIFIISKNSVSHTKNSKSAQVSVNHVSSLLKYRCLDKEYSTEEGNNVGTAAELITSILEGTEFTFDELHSARFYEKDGVTEKRRTLNASAKTGAFSLISNACSLFDAKPVYNGKDKTVKILPMNPFSIKAGQELPDFEYASNLIELNYNSNLKSVQRNIDSENICTVLYVLGSYGDKTSGYCNISELEFSKFSYTYTGTEGPFCYFVIPNYFTGIQHNVYFPTAGINSGDELEYYALDFASDYYVYNKTQDVIIHTCDVQAATLIVPTEERLIRNFDFLMDFDYFKEQGLLTEDNIDAIAEYQITARDVLEQIKEASEHETEVRSLVAKTIDYGYYAKLSIESIENKDGFLYLNLADTDLGEGIVYHSQSDSLRRNQWFQWRTTEYVDNYGDAVTKSASVIYICDKNNASYIKTFIKEIVYDSDGETKKALKLFWPYNDRLLTPTHYFIFGSDSTMGTFGSCEVLVENTKNSLIDATKYQNIKHPTYYVYEGDVAPSIPVDLRWGWLIRYTKNTYANWTLEFFYDVYDTAWQYCNYSNKNPMDCSAAEQGIYCYWYNYTNSTHWRRLTTTTNTWELLYDNTSKDVSKVERGEIASEMSIVWATISTLKRYYNGWYTKYTYNVTSDIEPNTYFFKDEFDDFIIFTTHETISAGDTLTFDAINRNIYPNSATANTSSVQTVKDYLARKYSDNELSKTDFHNHKVTETSKIETDTAYASTGSFEVRSSTPYTITLPTELVGKQMTVFWYSSSDVLISYQTITTTSTITSADGAKNCRLTVQGTVEQLKSVIFTRANNSGCQYIVYGTDSNNAEYSNIGIFTPTGERIGLIECLHSLCVNLDELHEVAIPEKKRLQQVSSDLTTNLVSSVGNLYRESWLQNDKYVDGDEEKLFDDGIKDIEELSKPTTSYSVGWVDLFNTDKDDKYKWEDVDTETAVYLVDDELGINQFAYIDKIVKCIDEPQRSTLAINTSLTKLSQQSFGDVMSNIAKVSEETKAAESIYKRAEALSTLGQLSADKLDGELFAATVAITGGTSNWSTDENGNMIFTAADGASAMMLSGNGILISNEKDEYGKWLWKAAITGSGMNASVINTGELNASLINAGAITTDKLASTVGEKLLINSNEEVKVFATKDGTIPSGAVDVVKNGGSLISINATDGITIASGANVDIQSGATVGITGAAVDINGGNVNMAATTKLNLSGAEINMNASSKLTVDTSAVEIKSGTLDLNSASSATIHGGDTGSSVVLDNSGVKVKGLTVDLQTSTQAGKITFNEGNYIDSYGKLSLCNDKLVLDGNDGSLTTTGAMNINANGSLNLTSKTSKINMTAGEINIGETTAGDTKVNITAGTLTASGGAIDIKAGSTLDIDSPALVVDSTNKTAEVYGKIVASEGLIGAQKIGSTWVGGWNIGNGKLWSGTVGSENYVELDANNEWAIKIGGDGNPQGGDDWINIHGQYTPSTWTNTGNVYETTIALEAMIKPGTTPTIVINPDTGGTVTIESDEGSKEAVIKITNPTTPPVASTTTVDVYYLGREEGTNKRPNFAVSNDGKVVIDSVWGYESKELKKLKRFDLRYSLYKMDAAYSTANNNATYNPTNMKAETDDTGVTTLTLTRNGQPDLIATFNSAGAINSYTFAKESGTETNITFSVTGVSSSGTEITSTKRGGFPFRIYATGSAGALKGVVQASINEQITLGKDLYAVLDPKTDSETQLTMWGYVKEDSPDGNTIHGVKKILTIGGNALKFGKQIQISRKLLIDETETLNSYTYHDVEVKSTVEKSSDTIKIKPSTDIVLSKGTMTFEGTERNILLQQTTTGTSASSYASVVAKMSTDDVEAVETTKHLYPSLTGTVGTNKITMRGYIREDSSTGTPVASTTKDITLYHSGNGADDTLTVSAYMSDGSVRTVDDDLVYTAGGSIYKDGTTGIKIFHNILTSSGGAIASSEVSKTVSVTSDKTVGTNKITITPSATIEGLAAFTGTAKEVTVGYQSGTTTSVVHNTSYDDSTISDTATLSIDNPIVSVANNKITITARVSNSSTLAEDNYDIPFGGASISVSGTSIIANASVNGTTFSNLDSVSSSWTINNISNGIINATMNLTKGGSSFKSITGSYDVKSLLITVPVSTKKIINTASVKYGIDGYIAADSYIIKKGMVGSSSSRASISKLYKAINPMSVIVTSTQGEQYSGTSSMIYPASTSAVASSVNICNTEYDFGSAYNIDGEKSVSYHQYYFNSGLSPRKFVSGDLNKYAYMGVSTTYRIHTHSYYLDSRVSGAQYMVYKHDAGSLLHLFYTSETSGYTKKTSVGTTALSSGTAYSECEEKSAYPYDTYYTAGTVEVKTLSPEPSGNVVYRVNSTTNNIAEVTSTTDYYYNGTSYKYIDNDTVTEVYEPQTVNILNSTAAVGSTAYYKKSDVLDNITDGYVTLYKKE